MEQRPDEQLLAEHRAGKPGAFDALVRRYSEELYRFLLKFVGQSATAEDLLQETLLQVHSAAATFDATRAFKPWLYTIAANKARDLLRSRSRRQELSLDGARDEDGAAPLHAIESEEIGAAESQDLREEREAVRRVIGGMPEHLRLILILGYYQQLPYADIAEVLGIPVGTVKSRLHAAVGQFAKLWQARTGGAPRRAER